MGKKKKQAAKSEDDAALPKFGGFKPLAGLEAFKKKIADEAKAEEEARAKAKLPPKPAPRPPPPKATATSSAEDELSFHRMMAGVVPLDAKAGRVAKSEGAAAAGGARIKPGEMREKAKVEAAQALDHLHALVDDAARFEVTDDGKHVEGRRSDVPPNMLRSLRRGLLPIDARLDLHGMTADDAQAKLIAFLRETRGRGERCVLVIHGKGEHSASPGGVLRGEIAAWLSQGRAREHVAAFASAQREDGGEGAVYVALRR
jgi:DNA-nicking Smr family endonuclease